MKKVAHCETPSLERLQLGCDKRGTFGETLHQLQTPLTYKLAEHKIYCASGAHLVNLYPQAKDVPGLQRHLKTLEARLQELLGVALPLQSSLFKPSPYFFVRHDGEVDVLRSPCLIDLEAVGLTNDSIYLKFSMQTK